MCDILPAVQKNNVAPFSSLTEIKAKKFTTIVSQQDTARKIYGIKKNGKIRFVGNLRIPKTLMLNIRLWLRG